MVRILLVEDDVRLARLVQEFLEKNGFTVLIEARGDRAAERIMKESPDLVILDIMLPGIDGFEVCKKVRPMYKNPILMLTARGDEADELVGLEIGADDYMAKPVKPQLLLARIKTLLRRTQRLDGGVRQIKQGTLLIDSSRRTVMLDSQNLDLTTAEFDLLWFLASHAGEVVTRDQISHSLRGHEWDGMDRSIDLSISRLRKKIGDDGRKPDKIRSVRGTGYMWVPE
ncbi:DNA-binding response regulator in two-component regulatory system with RstB [Candidatus Zixiibacteriota bacterium]|nr:DNA-binding response regulator in two-component regulatory system with RstB [candidate division Zixibacteria bacterium]